MVSPKILVLTPRSAQVLHVLLADAASRADARGGGIGAGRFERVRRNLAGFVADSPVQSE